MTSPKPDLAIPAPLLALLVAMLVAILIYLPGLNGGYVFDDGVNIVDNSQVHITDFSLSSLAQAAGGAVAGDRQRPLAMLSFGINHVLTGLDPWWMKTTNLGIHLLNGLLIFLLARGVFTGLARKSVKTAPGLPSNETGWLSAAVAITWILHPFNLTPVLYVVQRMTELSAFFVLLGLVMYVNGRLRMLNRRPGTGTAITVAGIAVMTPLAFLSKQNGALLPLLAWTIEFVVFRFRDPAGRRIPWLIAAFLFSVALPAIGGIIWYLLHPEKILIGYQIKPFTLTERLLSEPRMLWSYIGQIAVPRTNEMSVYSDDITISTDLFTPWTTLPAIVAWVIALVMAFRLRNRWPLFSLAVLFFLAGHAIESSFFSLLIAQDHRNYLPSVGPLLLISWLFFSASLHPQTARLRRLGGIALILLMATLTGLRSLSWSNNIELAITEVTNHPESTRAHNRLGGIYATTLANPETPPGLDRDELFDRAYFHLRRAADLLPTGLTALSSIVILHALSGRPLPDGIIDEMVARMSAKKIDIDHINAMRALTVTSQEYPQAIPGTLLEYFYEKILANPAYPPRVSAIMMVRYAKLLINHDKRFGDRAIELMREAIKRRPNTLLFHLNLATLLMRMDRLDEAERELDIAETIDPYNSVSHQVALSREQLQRLRAEKEHHPSSAPAPTSE